VEVQKAVSRAQWTTTEGDKTVCMSCYETITKKRRKIEKKQKETHEPENVIEEPTTESSQSTAVATYSVEDEEVYRHEHLTKLDGFQSQLKPYLLGKEAVDKVSYNNLVDAFKSLVNGEREVVIKEQQPPIDEAHVALFKQEKAEDDDEASSKQPTIVIKPNVSVETSYHFYQTFEQLLKIGGFTMPIVSKNGMINRCATFTCSSH